MHLSDRSFNLVTNVSLIAALAASLAPQFFKSAQPWSGYVALAAGVVAMCAFFASEFKTADKQEAVQPPAPLYEEGAAAEGVAPAGGSTQQILQEERDWPKYTIWDPSLVFGKSTRPKLPETERLRRIVQEHQVEFEHEKLVITVGLVTMEIVSETQRFRIASPSKVAARFVTRPSETITVDLDKSPSRTRPVYH